MLAYADLDRRHSSCSSPPCKTVKEPESAELAAENGRCWLIQLVQPLESVFMPKTNLRSAPAKPAGVVYILFHRVRDDVVGALTRR